ncbi:MAG: four helix bundle protein [Proteobacteria bacterium]|nr:four helix bundle protein [Pseudomonadota bacterium]MBU1738955.1 four helix bundle protein [Pseudomonadota bacterium]
MVADGNEIVERSMAYALRIIALYRELQKDDVGRVLGKQLLRSGTSIGANVNEAQGGQSKADFIAKMSIAQKEALESIYWLKLFGKAEVISADRLQDLMDEAGQLTKILSAILITAKK